MNIELDKTEKQENGLTKDLVIKHIVDSILPLNDNNRYCSDDCEHINGLGNCTLAGEEVLYSAHSCFIRTKSCLVLKPIHIEKHKAITKQEEEGAFRF